MNNKEIYQWAEEMCEIINEFSKCKIHPDSPIFKFKLRMIEAKNKYRKDHYQNYKFESK